MDANERKAVRQLEKEGNDTATRFLERRVDELKKQYPQFATPKQVLDFKRSIRGEWSGLHDLFIDAATAEANEAIRTSLPAAEAARFTDANRKVTNLITAEEAVNSRLHDQAAGAGMTLERLVEHGVRHGTRMGIGGAVGGAYGYYEGGRASPQAIVGGMIAGEVAGKIGEGAATKTIGVASRKALAKAAPHLAKAARYSPEAWRAYQVVQSILNAPSQ